MKLNLTKEEIKETVLHFGETTILRNNYENNIPNVVVEIFFEKYNHIKIYGPSLETFGQISTHTFKNFLERNGTIEALLTEDLESNKNSLISKFYLEYQNNIQIKFIQDNKLKISEEDEYRSYLIIGDEKGFIFKQHHKKDSSKSYIFDSLNNAKQTNTLNEIFNRLKN